VVEGSRSSGRLRGTGARATLAKRTMASAQLRRARKAKRRFENARSGQPRKRFQCEWWRVKKPNPAMGQEPGGTSARAMRRALLTATTTTVRWRPAFAAARRRTLATQPAPQPAPQRVAVDEETGETVAVVSSSGTTWVRASRRGSGLTRVCGDCASPVGSGRDLTRRWQDVVACIVLSVASGGYVRVFFSGMLGVTGAHTRAAPL